MTLKFDEAKLISELERLPATLRVAFAAACAERQIPAYRAFHAQTRQGDPDALQRALDEVWTDLGMGREAGELERRIEEIMSLIPQEDGFTGPWTQEATGAQNAGMSVAHTLLAWLSGDAQAAAWSARTAYDALDNFVINIDNIDINKPGEEQRVLSHPLIQTELARQQRDIDELLATNDGDVESSIRRLHCRAKLEAPNSFRPVSK